jgi:pimeloyl-ACP methyl ester carboxylesterase
MNNAPQTLAINLGDAELPYLYYHGRGRAVVMLHATGFLPWLWHPIARALVGDYRLIAPYFCDYRESDPASGLSWIKLAEDLSQMCERLNIASPVMVGHSMGATVMTIAQAAHSLAHTVLLRMPVILSLWRNPNKLFRLLLIFYSRFN